MRVAQASRRESQWTWCKEDREEMELEEEEEKGKGMNVGGARFRLKKESRRGREKCTATYNNTALHTEMKSARHGLKPRASNGLTSCIIFLPGWGFCAVHCCQPKIQVTCVICVNERGCAHCEGCHHIAPPFLPSVPFSPSLYTLRHGPATLGCALERQDSGHAREAEPHYSHPSDPGEQAPK